MKLNWEDDGPSLKSQLEQVWAQTGKKPAELDIETLPLELLYLEEVFWSIWNSEGWQWSEIYYYQLVNDIELDEADMFILRKAFNACLKFVNQKMKTKMKKPSSSKGKTHGR